MFLDLRLFSRTLGDGVGVGRTVVVTLGDGVWWCVLVELGVISVVHTVCVNESGKVTTLLRAVAIFRSQFLTSSPASNVGVTDEGGVFKR